VSPDCLLLLFLWATAAGATIEIFIPAWLPTTGSSEEGFVQIFNFYLLDCGGGGGAQSKY
jgi:hypothetical protein